MILGELGGSLTKLPQRNGISGSKPLDLDLAAQGEAVPRSNRGRARRIGRSRAVGRAGRGGAVAGALLRGGDFAGAGETGATELGLDRGLVQKRERGTCNPLGLTGERIGPRDAVSGGDGGRTRRRSPVRAF